MVVEDDQENVQREITGSSSQVPEQQVQKINLDKKTLRPYSDLPDHQVQGEGFERDLATLGKENERQASKEIRELQKGVFQKVSYWQQKASGKGNSKQELLLEKILEKLESIDARLAKIEQARKD